RILWCTPFILSALTSISGPAMAATNTLSGGLDNRYSDNAGKDSANANSDLESRVNLSYQHQSDPGRCESSADIKLGYGYWHQETFDDELYTNGRARGECELIKGLVWH